MSIFFSLIKDTLQKKILDGVREDIREATGRNDIDISYSNGNISVLCAGVSADQLIRENNIDVNYLAKKRFYISLPNCLENVPLLSVEIERNIKRSFCYSVRVLPPIDKNSYKYGILKYNCISILDRKYIERMRIIKASPFFLRGKYIYLTRLTDTFTEAILNLNIPEFTSGQMTMVRAIRVPSLLLKIVLKSNLDYIDPVLRIIGKSGSRIRALREEFSNERIQLVDCASENFLEEMFMPFVVNRYEIGENDVKLFLKRGYMRVQNNLSLGGAKYMSRDGAVALFEKIKVTAEEILKKKIYVSEEMYNLQRNREKKQFK